MSVMDRAGEAHPHVHEQLGVYVLGALPPAEAAAVERHLEGCPSCTEQALNLVEVRDLLGRLRPRDVAAIIGGPGDSRGADAAVRGHGPRPGPTGRRRVAGPPAPGPPTRPAGDRTRRRTASPRRRHVVLMGFMVVALAIGVGLGVRLGLRPAEI